MDEDLDAIATLSDDELVALTEGKRPDAAECALSELYYREHPQTAAIARRLWLRSPDSWKLAEEAIGSASPPVLTRIVEELATTDDREVFAQTVLIEAVRRRLADLPTLDQSLSELFHRRFDAR